MIPQGVRARKWHRFELFFDNAARCPESGHYSRGSEGSNLLLAILLGVADSDRGSWSHFAVNQCHTMDYGACRSDAARLAPRKGCLFGWSKRIFMVWRLLDWGGSSLGVFALFRKIVIPQNSQAKLVPIGSFSVLQPTSGVSACPNSARASFPISIARSRIGPILRSACCCLQVRFHLA